MYNLLADIIVSLHLLWILFLIFGALIGRKVKWVRALHIASLGFSVLLQLKSWICPLTHLEVWLRGKAGWTYSGNFIQHYVEKLVYLDVSRMAVFIGTIAVIFLTVVLYWKSFQKNQQKIS
ncbi:MAG: DUF2784 domain-containing protein [Calditrichaeota bacterium]|nr:DUF2784 domain-containing protein [Calditrichota bacterium]